MTSYRRQLIEVARPLKATNEASAREKSIRHGQHKAHGSPLRELLAVVPALTKDQVKVLLKELRAGESCMTANLPRIHRSLGLFTNLDRKDRNPPL